MKLLKKYDSLPQAYLDKGMLESHGIHTVVQADAISQIYPGLTSAGLGSILLYVTEEDFDKAGQLLSHKE